MVKKQPGVFIFPGQGVQRVGMGADLARDFSVAKEVFQEVDDALNQNLSSLMFSSDMDELTQTQNAQPAIMAVSMAVFRVLQHEIGSSFAQMISAVAGHSLGEYSALCSAKVLTLSEVARLLRARGLAMANACMHMKGGMLALLGVDEEQTTDLAKRTGVYVANDNAPGQVVLSGSLEHLASVKDLAEQMGIRRCVDLTVGGAFHSPLMESAADEMRVILAQIKFKKPVFPVAFNVTASIETDVQNYSSLLTQQITAPVRWRELVQNLNVTNFVECGPGNVLAGLMKRIVPTAEGVSLGSTETIKSFLSALK